MTEKLKIIEDNRGKLIEIFKIPGFGQVNYSTSKQKVKRGNHYHTRKEEKFCVIEGIAKIRLKSKETGEIKEIVVDGQTPEIVDIPKGWIHNIENLGDSELKLLIWISEIYDPDDADTFMEEI